MQNDRSRKQLSVRVSARRALGLLRAFVSLSVSFTPAGSSLITWRTSLFAKGRGYLLQSCQFSLGRSVPPRISLSFVTMSEPLEHPHGQAGEEEGEEEWESEDSWESDLDSEAEIAELMQMDDLVDDSASTGK